ncbi:glutathione binding-like protein [Uliginosibacterium sp. H3]|uniref:Glutathione binding-like protein n=1 Tax=Uliginosibacterium silvisoli TaxID=3114758 RepID=A0ABU6K6G3_9RHOO|nr:glutathione binding-like protein [Uliginosibacterium sp. H3]
MTKLYVAQGACSFGAHVAARELGLPIEFIKVPLRTPESPIHKVNPLGRVPTLVSDSGEVITENGAILPFLADLKPEAGLAAPAGSVERAQIQEWIGFLNSDIHGAYKPVNRPNLFHADEEVQKSIREGGIARLRDLIRIVQRKLEGKTWAVGERFTVADAYLGVFLRWLPRAGIEIGSEFPGLAAYLERYNARESVKAAAAFEAA